MIHPLDIGTDRIFKLMFGAEENKNVLISKTSDKKDLLNAWLKFLTNAADKENLKEKKIHKVYDTLMRISANDEVREISRLREETEYNRISEQNTAMEEGVKKGKPDERAKAAAEKIEIAKSLLSMGLSVEQVSQATWLSVDEVNSLNKLLK